MITKERWDEIRAYYELQEDSPKKRFWLGLAGPPGPPPQPGTYTVEGVDAYGRPKTETIVIRGKDVV